jgi:lipopolysaccharide/colanic/teichoic acid biosynthesis glycosyltransferase
VSIQNLAGVFETSQPVSGNAGPKGGSVLFWTGKRAFDIVVSLALLPFLAIIALALMVLNPKFNKGPLFFRQTRMGQDLQPFTAIKFRSMQPAAEITRSVDDPIEVDRITALGRVLRKTRFDELPQILNVLGGEMSLIGPRPDYFEHAREFVDQIPEYRARHMIRPGISGLAQVTLGYAEGLDATRAKATADLAYIRNASLGLEVRIFWLTLATVLMRKGA